MDTARRYITNSVHRTMPITGSNNLITIVLKRKSGLQAKRMRKRVCVLLEYRALCGRFGLKSPVQHRTELGLKFITFFGVYLPLTDAL